MIPDTELLRQYAESKSQASFAELVDRHLNLVYSAALRRCSGDAHRAADVAQHVFTALARQAPRLTTHTVLTAWLYAATRNTACDVMRNERRRLSREREAQAMHQINHGNGDTDWEHLRPVLDAAMDALSEEDRTAVLLRIFEQRRFAEVGMTLNLSPDAARMRVERALDKLREALVARGITSTSAAMSVLLANRAVAAAPAGLAATIAGIALNIPVTVGGGAILLGFMNSTKIAAAVAALGVVTLGSTIVPLGQARAVQRSAAAAARESGALTRQVAAAVPLAQDKEKAVEERRLAALNAPPPKAAAPVDDINARNREINDRLTKEDEELRRAERVYSRHIAQERLAPFLRRGQFTPAETEQLLDLFVAAKADTTALLASINAEFGDERGRQLADFLRTGAARQIVADLSARLYYIDSPFTPLQSARLIDLVYASLREKAPAPPRAAMGLTRNTLNRFVDWDRVIAEAEPQLTPAQVNGLRAMAAQARVERQLYAANAEAAAQKK